MWEASVLFFECVRVFLAKVVEVLFYLSAESFLWSRGLSAPGKEERKS